MNSRTILRREWFGGVLVQTPGGRPVLLDQAGYARTRSELAAQATAGQWVRLVDAEELGYPIRQDALATPGLAYLEITKQCNAACTHCYAHASADAAPNELTLAEWTRVIRRLASGGVYYVRLSGGEPTLRPDLLDLLDILAAEGITAALNSHGRFGERTLEQLVRHGVQDVRLSVDGTETIHDAIRGPGAYREVLATLRRLAEYNRSAASRVETTMNVVLMKTNRACLGPLAALATELDCIIRFGLLRPAGRAQRELMLSPEEVLQVAYEIARYRRQLGLGAGRARFEFDVVCEPATEPTRFRPFPFDNSKCPIGTTGLGVSADGWLMPCTFLGYMDDGRWLGENVRDHDILDLWQRSETLTVARSVRRGGCSGCVHYQTRCQGGCPATAYGLTGDLDGRDPYCVRDVPMHPMLSVPSVPSQQQVAAPDPSPDLKPNRRTGITVKSEGNESQPTVGEPAKQASATPPATVPSLLRAIRRLGLYNDSEWTEYSQAFITASPSGSGAVHETPTAEIDLAGRSGCGEGARPVEPDFALSPKIIRGEDLARLKAQRGLRLGVVSGAFDLLHLGHLRNMQFARDWLGSDLHVALCAMTLSDEAIRAKKGPTRPVLNWNERLALLAAIRGVDYVVPLAQADGLYALGLLEPEWFFKSPADLVQASVRREVDLVASQGGAAAFSPTHGAHALSTTRLLEAASNPSADTHASVATSFSPTDSLNRLRAFARPRDGAGRFPELLYEAALAEVGLPRPLAWSGVKRAFLVTFDGPSGVGKDTQLRLLHQRLRRAGVRRVMRADLKCLDPFRLLLKRLWEEPEFDGQRDLALGLLTCARRYAVDALLGRWLEDVQTIVLQNHSFLSHAAYYASSPAELDHGLAVSAFDPPSDLPLLLDCDPALASTRVRQRAPEKGNRVYPNEQPDSIARVRRNFAVLQQRWPNLVQVDAAREPKCVAEDIAHLFAERLGQQGNEA